MSCKARRATQEIDGRLNCAALRAWVPAGIVPVVDTNGKEMPPSGLKAVLLRRGILTNGIAMKFRAGISAQNK
jgi:hypothetical protein